MSSASKPPTSSIVVASPSTSPSKSSSTSGSSSSRRSNTTETERLNRAWKALVSSVVVSTRAADKLGKTPGGSEKELEEAVNQTLRARGEFRRLVTIIEANLLGQAKETEALVGLLHSQPSLGKRKRENGNRQE